MRIRSIKPEFWRSDDITALPFELRLLFIGLWSYVDDNGVGIDDVRHIAAELFALEEDQNAIRQYVREGLIRLSTDGLLTRYEVNGKQFLHVNSWSRHQRVTNPNRPRYPLPGTSDPVPTCDDSEPIEGQTTIALVSIDGHSTGTEEQRNRVKKPRSTSDPDFDRFWAAYPKKVKKPEAFKKWQRVIRDGTTPDEVIAAVKRYAASVSGKSTDYIAHPTTWLNQGRWSDEDVQTGNLRELNRDPGTGRAVDW